jgi:Rrf2 family protein
MRLSQKAAYAVRAMLELALHSGDGAPARLAVIARRAKVPEKFLEAIVVDLRKAGLVNSRRGPEGGHVLARSPDAITLGQIRAAIDGPLVLVEAPTRSRATGPSEQAMQTVWKEVERAIGAVLDGVTVEEMCRRVRASIDGPDFSI